MYNDIIRKMMYRVKRLHEMNQQEQLVNGDVMSLIDDLEETVLYFCHIAEILEEENHQWREGTRTKETEAAQKAAFEEFERTIKES